MQSIWKFEIPLQITKEQTLELPAESEILSVLVQEGDRIVLYAICNTSIRRGLNPKIWRYRIFGTGHDMDDNFQGNFIATVALPDSGLVFHIFEVHTQSMI